MFNALKTIGTVLTVAQAAQFGKEAYAKYKDKKRIRQVNEVHEFIGQLDLNALKLAIESGDTDKLIDAVENIMNAAESVKVKSDLEEIKDDVSAVAKSMFDKLSKVANKAVSKASQKFDTTNLDDDSFDVPSFQDFIEGAKLKVLTKNGPLLVSVHDENVKQIFITESINDAIHLNGMAVLSKNITKEQFTILKSFNFQKKRLVFVLDNDKLTKWDTDLKGGELGKLVLQEKQENWFVSMPTFGDNIKDVSESIVHNGILETYDHIMSNFIFDISNIKMKMQLKSIKLKRKMTSK